MTTIGGTAQGVNPNIANGRIVLNDQSQLGSNGAISGAGSLNFSGGVLAGGRAGNAQMIQQQQGDNQQPQSFAYNRGRGGRGGQSYGGQGEKNGDEQQRELAQYQQKLAEGNSTGLPSTLGSQPSNVGFGPTTATILAGQSRFRNP